MEEKILLADDHGIVKLGLSLMIKNLRPQAVVEEVEDFEAVIKLVSQKPFDLFILDINMPKGTFQSTFEFIKIKQPNAKVLIFSSLDPDLYALRYIKAGVDGFLSKLANTMEVKLALEKMFSSGRYLSEDLKDSLLFNSTKKESSEENPIKLLSNREIEIAARLIKGARLKSISNDLNIHISTISTYKMRIFEKLDIQSIPELIELFQFYHQD